jgi:hydroxymethylpyrimidine/phosphomethylpyrimidine kinase
VARIVLVGGVDPGTGAGLARDLLVATALGARAIVVGTAWTEQDARATLTVEPRQPERVAAALTAALRKAGDAGTAVKIGMVASAAIADAVTSALEPYTGPVIFDPVVRASGGTALYDGDKSALLALARRATLVTPNLDEAAWLLDRPVRGVTEARAAAAALRELGIPAVLLKGGHLEGDATDVLLTAGGESLLSAQRVPGPSPRGTGCTLATAIAVELAAGQPLESAVGTAKVWLTRRIEQAASVGNERHL